MRIVIIACVVGLTLVAGAISLLAADGEGSRSNHISAAEELLVVMGAQKDSAQMIRDMVNGLVKQSPTMEPYREVMMIFYTKHIGWANIKNDMARIYMEVFTEEELRAVTAFYRTPAGMAWSKKMPRVRKRSQELVMKRVERNSKELIEMIKAETERLKNE